MLVLHLVDDSGVIASHDTSSELTLGRARDNSVRIASPAVARHQARVQLSADGAAMLTALAAGVRVRGRDLDLFASVELAHGDCVDLGGQLAFVGDPFRVLKFRTKSGGVVRVPKPRQHQRFGGDGENADPNAEQDAAEQDAAEQDGDGKPANPRRQMQRAKAKIRKMSALIDRLKAELGQLQPLQAENEALRGEVARQQRALDELQLEAMDAGEAADALRAELAAATAENARLQAEQGRADEQLAEFEQLEKNWHVEREMLLQANVEIQARCRRLHSSQAKPKRRGTAGTNVFMNLIY